MRTSIMVLMALFGLAIGALFTLPIERKEFAAVEVNGVSLIAEVAADSRAKTRGLAGREEIAGNEGMLFVFAKPGRYGVWMKGMRFPIDVLWIKKGIVADIEEEINPALDLRVKGGVGPESDAGDAALAVWRPDVAAYMILEIRAGFARSHRVKIGDRVRIRRKAAVLAAAEAAISEVPRTATFASNFGTGTLIPGEEYFIETLRENPPRGSNFKLRKVLETNRAYQKFLISYESDGLILTGVMNVPFGPVPAVGFPVLILNHGLISPGVYYSGRGSRREQDFFARRGYVTIHPDYRGYSGKPADFPAHHDFYVGYSRDVLGLIDALKRQDQHLVDMQRIGMWGHSMGGGIAARVAVLSPDVKAVVLFAPISAEAEDNFYELAAGEVKRLYATYGPAGADVYRRISPLAYFADVPAPVQLHHGLVDKEVPVSFSQKMYRALAKLGKKTELFTYPGEKHEFGDAWTLAAERSLQFFERYVKNR